MLCISCRLKTGMTKWRVGHSLDVFDFVLVAIVMAYLVLLGSDCLLIVVQYWIKFSRMDLFAHCQISEKD